MAVNAFDTLAEQVKHGPCPQDTQFGQTDTRAVTIDIKAFAQPLRQRDLSARTRNFLANVVYATQTSASLLSVSAAELDVG